MNDSHEPRPSTHMTKRARQLRKQSPIPERLLWGRLRGRRLAGLKFRRQTPIGPYVVDFFCEAAALVVELDGMSHLGAGDADAKRSDYLKSRGLSVMRVTNDDVIHHGDEVAEFIARTAIGLVNEAQDAKAAPHPNPLPEGEGVEKSLRPPRQEGEFRNPRPS